MSEIQLLNRFVGFSPRLFCIIRNILSVNSLKVGISLRKRFSKIPLKMTVFCKFPYCLGCFLGGKKSIRGFSWVFGPECSFFGSETPEYDLYSHFNPRKYREKCVIPPVIQRLFPCLFSRNTDKVSRKFHRRGALLHHVIS